MIWKNIKGYEGLYQVSDEGEVRSLNYRGNGEIQVLRSANNNYGYPTVVLVKNGKHKTHTVHRLVASAFLSNPENLPYINHKDENRTNNTVSNLEWCTPTYNNTYGSRIEKFIKSKSKPIRQFTLDGEVVKDWESATQIAKITGYNQGNIISVCNEKRKTANNYIWKYI